MAKDRLDDKKHDGLIDKTDANRDPITGAPGSHPVGTGLGAAGAGAAGAAIGAMAGPIGSLAGAAIGAIAGGLAGKGVGEMVNPTVEDEYWRENYTTRPYVEPGMAYDTYQPAYRYGWEARTRHHDRRWDEVEPELSTGWEQHRGTSSLTWEKAKHASRDAWDRLERAIPGDADRDGK